MRFALILAAALAAAPAAAERGNPPPAKKENVVKRGGTAFAQDAKTGAKQAGKAYGDAGRSIGRGTVSFTKRLGREIKDSYRRTAKEAKETF